jgi:hypothetical protein
MSVHFQGSERSDLEIAESSSRTYTGRESDFRISRASGGEASVAPRSLHDVKDIIMVASRNVIDNQHLK